MNINHSSETESSDDSNIKREVIKKSLVIRLSNQKLNQLSIPSLSDEKTPDGSLNKNDLVIDENDIGPFSLDCSNLKRKKVIKFQEDYGIGGLNDDLSKNFSLKKPLKNKTSYFKNKFPIDDEFDDLRNYEVQFHKSMPKEFRSSSIFEKLEEKFNSTLKEQV